MILWMGASKTSEEKGMIVACYAYHLLVQMVDSFFVFSFLESENCEFF